MSDSKKPYTRPEIRKYSAPSQVPKYLQSVLAEVLNSELTVLLDEHRVYQSVSPQFAKLLGYDPDELTGKTLDDVTVKGTVDIDFIFDAFLKLGEMDGLWMFRDRNGKSLLFHYHASRLQEHLVCANLELLALAG